MEAYEKVYPNLKGHDSSYPTPEYLKSKVRIGNIEFDGDISKDTPGSELILSLIHIWNVLKSIAELIEEEPADNMYSLAITNQRETVVVWNKHKGKPLYNAVAVSYTHLSAAGRREGSIMGRNDKGLVTYDRKIKKDAFYFFRIAIKLIHSIRSTSSICMEIC